MKGKKYVSNESYRILKKNTSLFLRFFNDF